MKKYIVITTINSKSDGIIYLEQLPDWDIVVVGDRKSQNIQSSQNLTYLSVSDQQDLGYKFIELCPYDHYARKNIGYLYAFQQGAEIIFDTDDDNTPLDNWKEPAFLCDTEYFSDEKFINIYKYFSDNYIWPRGYPLDEIRKETHAKLLKTDPVNIGVWQGLADNDADVDAVFRLIFDHKTSFKHNPPIFLGAGHYSPFNSQNTFWQRSAFPYLYLPATTSFRFTDILRSYIAQPLMWKKKLALGITGATVYQERNAHDLMKDFHDEIECYLNIKKIVSALDTVQLIDDPFANLEMAYISLLNLGIVKQEEISLLQTWIADFRNLI